MKAANYYQIRVEKAIEYISESFLSGKIPTLDSISSAAGLSKYHFHRVFKLVTGETLQQIMGRIKLSKAAINLAKDNLTITEAAIIAGFESSQSLAKALKRECSVTATELKNDSERLSETLTYLSLPSPNKTGIAQLSIELTSLEPFSYLAVPTEGAYPDLNQVYHQLFNTVGDPLAVRAILGIPDCNAECLQGDSAIFDCGLLLTEGLVVSGNETIEKSLSGGSFVRVQHVGTYDGLDRILDYVYEGLLSQEDVCLADNRCLFHYLDDPEEVAESSLRTDIYIPVALEPA
ncbi:MAG: AraC family transcriptional regulator [Gammaproteobacteria bacterium]|nr:AraC family transcriptional regulator [Gammaproteobacteria bacterium]